MSFLRKAGQLADQEIREAIEPTLTSPDVPCNHADLPSAPNAYIREKWSDLRDGDIATFSREMQRDLGVSCQYVLRDLDIAAFKEWESTSGSLVTDLSTIHGLGLDGDGEAADEIHGRLRQAFEAGAKGSLDSLTPEQRLEVMADYCTGCGVKDSRCPCRNDE